MAYKRKSKPDLGSMNQDTSRDDLFVTREDRAHFLASARDAALRMSAAALRRGATADDPCGLDDVLEVLFGKDKEHCKRKEGE